jgi:hypothetical protein
MASIERGRLRKTIWIKKECNTFFKLLTPDVFTKACPTDTTFNRFYTGDTVPLSQPVYEGVREGRSWPNWLELSQTVALVEEDDAPFMILSS